MNPPNGEETIFAEALRLPPEERAAYLARSTEGNAELRGRIEALLGSYESGGFLEEAAASELRATLAAASVSVTEKPGDLIGRYKLLQQIGEGGCGVVYMAEQSEPVRRRVALKIIKLGMDTKSVIARFEAERQALAMMDHSNIAKVYDAGATETGRPYFVMELVRGLKITEYCDEAKLSTRARLDLFVQVCQAIQHAHQKGIIHRDIKPSNILVTVNDGVAVPKVIDFGIAKATSGQQLTDKTVFTAFEQFIGTPAYMSPEQAVLTSLDIDTRSDIYALGVLLYELLTGKTPFDAKELLAIGLDEMRRTIREKEPQRPSTCLSTLGREELSTTAQRRGLDAPKLVSELRGDLDWIVMKALEKDRARRYETSNGLAMDVQRHLNNEPVVARPPSGLYRFQKAVQRNKLAFASACAVVGALTLGLLVSSWMFLKVQAEKKKAEKESAKSEQVAKFLTATLASAGPSVALGRDATILREILDETAKRVAKDLQAQPEAEADLQAVIGRTYFDIGQYESARKHLERALKLRREILGVHHRLTLSTAVSLSNTMEHNAQWLEAERILREVLVHYGKHYGSDEPGAVGARHVLGNVLKRKGELSESIAILREVVRSKKKFFGSRDGRVSSALVALGAALQWDKRFDEAVEQFEEAGTICEKAFGAESEDVAYILMLVGETRCEQERYVEAEEAVGRSIAIYRQGSSSNTLQSAGSFVVLTKLLIKQNRLLDAEKAALSAWDIFKDRPSKSLNMSREALKSVALVYEVWSKTDPAKSLAAEEWKRKYAEFVAANLPGP